MSRFMTKPTKWLCTQRRLRSAWASAQSDQSLCCLLNGWLRAQAFFMWTAKTLIRLGRCPGWSQSSLGAHAILLVLTWGGSDVSPKIFHIFTVHTSFKDSTAQYIQGLVGEISETGLVGEGLQCVAVLIGVYDKLTGLPLIGVTNQPFDTLDDKGK